MMRAGQGFGGKKGPFGNGGGEWMGNGKAPHTSKQNGIENAVRSRIFTF